MYIYELVNKYALEANRKLLNKEVDVVTIGSKMHDYFKQQLEEDMIKLW